MKGWNHAAFLLLMLSAPLASQSPFSWRDLGNGRMELAESGKPALVYNYGPQLKEGVPEDRRRCCYIFPLYTPAGVSVLDDFPRDHYHHRGLFWAWPIVETGGKRYDLWMAFTVKHRALNPPSVRAGNQDAVLETVNLWEADGKDIVRESVRLKVYPVRGNTRELEAELTLEALGAPVTLQGSAEAGKSYGGFSARFAPRQQTVIRADGQVISRDEDLVPHHWAELEAVYGGRRAVLRITSDEKNPGAPYQWCLRNYGFIGASFPGRTATVDRYTLDPGKPVTLRFRVALSDLP